MVQDHGRQQRDPRRGDAGAGPAGRGHARRLHEGRLGDPLPGCGIGKKDGRDDGEGGRGRSSWGGGPTRTFIPSGPKGRTTPTRTTLTKPGNTWPPGPSRSRFRGKTRCLLKGDAEDAVAELKKQSGMNLGILGSGELIHSLLQRNLIDEFVLGDYPDRTGRGPQAIHGRDSSANSGWWRASRRRRE